MQPEATPLCFPIGMIDVTETASCRSEESGSVSFSLELAQNDGIPITCSSAEQMYCN